MKLCAFMKKTLKNVKDSKINEHQGVEVECHVCKTKKKGGLTLFQFYPKNGKVYWKNKILSCSHMDWDGEPGCSCCHTIRDGKPVCGNCAGWDILSGSITNEMKFHNFTWDDGTVSAWKARPGMPYKQFECDCGHTECFEFEKTKQEYQCPKCKPKKRIRDLEDENKALRAKLAKIEHLFK